MLLNYIKSESDLAGIVRVLVQAQVYDVCDAPCGKLRSARHELLRYWGRRRFMNFAMPLVDNLEVEILVLI